MAEKSALIVDDSATARIMLARVLATMDVASKHAKSGEEALSMLKLERPDLIFLDHLMPGMDGFQTLKAIKSNPDICDIPVVMYTSQSALKYREEAKALGAAAVITKQVDREQLYLLVERIWIHHEIVASRQVIGEDSAANQTVAAAMRGNVVALRPNQAQATDAEQDEPPTHFIREELRDLVKLELRRIQERSRQDINRFKNILIVLLAVSTLFALFSLNEQKAHVKQLESQIEANRKVMQEMVDILERSQ